MDELYEQRYKSEMIIGQLVNVFSFLAIFISCLGLFGLATFMAEQRTKEIGIRKVMGASVFSITSLLSGDLLKLVLVSIIIASPIAWLLINNWLMGFAYRTSISWKVFALTGMSTIFIALLTVSFQAIKSAIANPVKSLRME